MSQKLFPESPVLVVDDDENFLASIDGILKTNCIRNVERCQKGEEVLTLLEKNKYSVVLLDMKMPGVGGEKLLMKIVELYPEIPVIMITGFPEGKSAVDCMKRGAFYYFIKSDNTDVLLRIIKDALDIRGFHKDVIRIKKDLFSDSYQKPLNFMSIITQSEKMYKIIETIGLIAVTSEPVLIRGETGVGKELVAQAIHRLSQRKGKFISVNAASISDDLFHDTFFGHEKGAFTGADKKRNGLIEAAKGGTIFLDEIGDLSLQSQVNLLRLLQEREFFPLGMDESKSTNARIVAATNREILSAIKEGVFREDLYFRLETHDIDIPPLRKRKEDIQPLLVHFLEESASKQKKKTPTFPKELITLLLNHHFPGNVRELQNMVHDAVARHQKGILSKDVFLEKIKKKSNNSAAFFNTENTELNKKKVTFGETLPTFSELEEIFISEAMTRAKGNISMAARFAGISRNRFKYRMKKVKEKKEKGEKAK